MIISAFAGCVERTISINTEPTGATVILNDQEIGRSPVKAPFTWYGDYDIIIRKSGYKTIHTNHRTPTPWYEIPFIDIFSECLVPVTMHDDHVLETFVLEKSEHPEREQLLKNAQDLRERSHATE